MNKMILVAIVIANFLTRTGLSQESSRTQKLMGCWDGTFAYNMFQVEQTRTHYFITMAGSSLGGSGNAEGMIIGNGIESIRIGHDFHPVVITATFKKEECEWEEVLQSISCDAGTDDVYNKTEALYMEKKIDHMGAILTVISKYPVAKISVDANVYEGLTLTETRKYADGQVNIQKLMIRDHGSALDCSINNGNSFLQNNAPYQLVELLSSL